MITLAEALRLCNKQNNHCIALRTRDDEPRIRTHFISVKTLTDRLDLTKVFVTRIEPIFGSYGDFDGLVFTVRGLTYEQIWKLSVNAF
jgi:hypothetical protein